MGSAGKFIRHVLSAIVGGLVAYVVASLELAIGPDEQAAFVASTVVIVYAVLEKALKRFGWLDPEGAADLISNKAEAETLKKRGVL